jgi:16S rRNA (cytosine967-C5)-methyltransferase
MSGNYRPRRRYGAPGKAAGPSAEGTAAKGTTANGPSGKGTAAKGTAAKGASAKAAPAAARRDTARRANLPRRTAYDVLAAVRDRAAYANLLLPRLLAERQLTGRDAALATELAYGTLRGQGSYDAVLAACSDRPLDKLDPPVVDILRLGTHQLLSTRVGAHAAVATSVDLAKAVVGPRVSGYVNAVLRRVATRDLETWLGIVAPDRATDRNGYLAIRYSHPRWIVAAYRAALGAAADEPAGPADVATPAPAPPVHQDPAGGVAAPPAAGDDAAPAGAAAAAATETVTEAAAVTELEAALAAGNARPRVAMATFPSGSPRADVMPADAEPGRWSPYAFTLASGDPSPLINSGAAAVQDEGSQLAVIALSRAPLSPPPGQAGGKPARWLDMCAGPGGKSRMLYGLAAASGAALVAAELHPHRAALVESALNRVSSPGNPPYEVIVADSTRPPWPAGRFDRVLVDVPCSGLGALRRRPEARWRKSPGDLKELAALQRDLLRSGLTAVRPGGVVGYVTCSPVLAETRDVVADVLATMPDVEILDAPAILADVPDTRSGQSRFAQLWPHRHGTDAIFIALLRRSR